MSDTPRLLSDAELAAIAEREQKATPGPWEVSETSSSIRCTSLTATGARGTAKTIASSIKNGGQSECARIARLNLDFIAHAREDMSRLIADYLRCRAWLRRLVELRTGVPGSDLYALADEVRAALEESP